MIFCEGKGGDAALEVWRLKIRFRAKQQRKSRALLLENRPPNSAIFPARRSFVRRSEKPKSRSSNFEKRRFHRQDKDLGCRQTDTKSVKSGISVCATRIFTVSRQYLPPCAGVAVLPLRARFAKADCWSCRCRAPKTYLADTENQHRYESKNSHVLPNGHARRTGR